MLFRRECWTTSAAYWSVVRLLRQVRVVLLLIAGIITAAGWLVFAIALKSTLNDELSLRGLVVCLFGMALVGVLSIASRAERETRRNRAQFFDFTTPRTVFFVVWLSLVGAASWSIGSSYGGLLSDQSGWPLTGSFAADLLTVAWGGLLGRHRAWGWVAGSAVAAATVVVVAAMAAYEETGGDGPYWGFWFLFNVLLVGIALLVGVSCMAVARSVARSVTSVGGGH
jgi:hypothetical protein